LRSQLDVQADRLAAERELAAAEPELAAAEPTPTLTRREVRALVEAVRDRLIGLDGATPEQRAKLYGSMGLRLTCHPERDVLEIECRPACTQARVGGGTCNFVPRPVVVESPWSELNQAA
jgi:hypothetical protein